MTSSLADQQNPRSASYHKWLTPEQYASRFGLSPVHATRSPTGSSLRASLVVEPLAARNFIVFSGTAAQVDKTFQVQLHNFKVTVRSYFATTTAPTIPAALSGIVADFHGFNNFRPVSQARKAVPGYTYVNIEQNYYFLAPGDVAAIYDLDTLYQRIDGTGQAIVVLVETDIYQSTILRLPLRLSVSPPLVARPVRTDHHRLQHIELQVHPDTGDADPGAPDSIGDDLPEADIDLECSGATARDAK